eukprot:97800-Amorphochlora_amoeboformis.AAC.1
MAVFDDHKACLHDADADMPAILFDDDMRLYRSKACLHDADADMPAILFDDHMRLYLPKA